MESYHVSSSVTRVFHSTLFLKSPIGVQVATFYLFCRGTVFHCGNTPHFIYSFFPAHGHWAVFGSLLMTRAALNVPGCASWVTPGVTIVPPVCHRAGLSLRAQAGSVHLSSSGSMRHGLNYFSLSLDI